MTNDSKDPKFGKPEIPNESTEQGTGKKSGRVSFDSRGNSVWEWQLETGVYSRDVSTQKLKKLDLGDLSIAETAIQPGPLSLEEEPPAPGGGFNPYNTGPRAKQQGGNPYDNARNASNKLAPQQEPPKDRPRNLDDLRKLSEWIKQKKKTEKGE